MPANRDSAGNAVGETVLANDKNNQTNLDFDKPHRIKVLHGNWDRSALAHPPRLDPSLDPRLDRRLDRRLDPRLDPRLDQRKPPGRSNHRSLIACQKKRQKNTRAERTLQPEENKESAR